MGVFKEEIMFLEDLAKHQSRIWNDSADVGISSSEVDMDRMREVIKTLLSLPGSQIVWKANRPSIQRQYALVVMWGHHDEGLYDATKVDLLYFKGKGKEFFSINVGHVYTDREGRTNNYNFMK